MEDTKEDHVSNNANITIMPLIIAKQKILGRKEKIDVGKPGIARAKAIQKVMHSIHIPYP